LDDLPQSGVPGVNWDRRSSKWRAQITALGKPRYIGLFDSRDEAVAARSAAEAQVRGQIAASGGKRSGRISPFEIDVMRRTMHDLLEADHPQSVRHVFYLMTDTRLQFHVEKSEEGYRLVQRQLAAMREEGVIPYGWIADATRMGWHVYTYRDAADFIRQMQGLYRTDLWARSGVYCEVWAESRSIASVLRDDCEELGVSLYPAGGFSSLTLCYEAAKQIAIRSGTPTIASRSSTSATMTRPGC
jgi:hypothetical protein